MGWGSGVLAFGIVVVVGFFVVPLVMENVIYDTPSEANSKVSSSSISGMNAGTKVSFVGTVRSTGNSMLGYSGMEVNGFNGYIICQDSGFHAGDKVIVTGHVYGYKGDNVVIGSSTWSLAFGDVSPAEVSRVWWGESFCTMVLILGIVLVVVGIVGMAVSGMKNRASTSPVSFDSPPGPDTPPQTRPSPQYEQPPRPMQPPPQWYQPMQYPPGMGPQYPPYPQQMGQPYYQPPPNYPPGYPPQQYPPRPQQYHQWPPAAGPYRPPRDSQPPGYPPRTGQIAGSMDDTARTMPQPAAPATVYDERSAPRPAGDIEGRVLAWVQEAIGTTPITVESRTERGDSISFVIKDRDGNRFLTISDKTGNVTKFQNLPDSG